MSEQVDTFSVPQAIEWLRKRARENREFAALPASDREYLIRKDAGLWAHFAFRLEQIAGLLATTATPPHCEWMAKYSGLLRGDVVSSPHWACGNPDCRGDNFPDDAACVHCGAPRTAAKPRGECICPKCGLRHGTSNTDGGF